ncbi:MAG: DUF2849 domain-containing protein [Hydrogenophilaceae bacterium]|jgi:hypothetical protein|nr:DUF2849 domain-containing protein [Hydrogenophilaceae bacterium]
MKMLTAHDLKTGAVVYWSGDGRWTPRIADAALLEDAAAAEALKAAEAAETVIVHPYLVPMDQPAAPIARERVRELIRARGPSTHPEFARP